MVLFHLQLLSDTIGFAKQSNQRSNFPHQKNQHFHNLCAKGLLNPQSNLSLYGRFPASSTKSLPLCTALLIFPSKPIISLCCTDVEGNAQLFKDEQKFIGKYPLHLSVRCHITSGCFVLQHTTLTSSQELSGCYKCVVPQNSSVDQATEFTSKIYKPRLIDDHPCSPWCRMATFRVINKGTGAGKRSNLHFSDYEKQTGIFVDSLIYSWNLGASSGYKVAPNPLLSFSGPWHLLSGEQN